MVASSVSWQLVKCMIAGTNTGKMGDKSAGICCVWLSLELGLLLFVIRSCTPAFLSIPCVILVGIHSNFTVFDYCFTIN